jgi:signal transduction histidine kinase
VAAWLAVGSIALIAGGMALAYLDRHLLSVGASTWNFSNVLNGVTLLAIPVIGFVVASRRPGNRIGWLFLAAGLASGVNVFSQSYGLRALLAAPGSLPAGRAAMWLSSWTLVVPIGAFAFLLLLFPTGQLRSPRWRPAAWFVGGVFALCTAVVLVGATRFWSHPFSGPLSQAVTAQDEARRRLERNLHDGAQQDLVALSIKAQLADITIDEDPAQAKQILGEIKADAAGALENLRDLARGIYPPLLADLGLAAALSAQANKSPLPVTVEADGIGRFGQDTEAAVYFCCLEALQNTAKYAHATQARVCLQAQNGSLRFTVSDDGTGYDARHIPMGSGLRNMADRLAALGGRLEVQSVPTRGTTITGHLPTGSSPAPMIRP